MFTFKFKILIQNTDQNLFYLNQNLFIAESFYLMQDLESEYLNLFVLGGLLRLL